MPQTLRVERPSCPSDMLSSDLSLEAEVVVLPGGRIVYGVPTNSQIYGNDPAFLRAVIEAMRLEVERLERELQKSKKGRSKRTRTSLMK